MGNNNMMADSSVARGLHSVDRAISLLQLLADSGATRTTDIANELGVHKSTASRLLATLERRGMVDRVDDGMTFVIGHGVALLAANAARPRTLTEASRETIAELAAIVGETVSINILTPAGDLLTLDQVMGPSAVSGFNWLGQHSPAYATAAGKALLAFGPEERITDTLEQNWQQLTAHTHTPAQVIEELPDIAQQGYALSRDELEEGLSAIAAPVYDSNGIIAAISASGPSWRIFDSTLSERVQSIISAAAEVSSRFGKRPMSD